jgi:hypothetical protein
MIYINLRFCLLFFYICTRFGLFRTTWLSQSPNYDFLLDGMCLTLEVKQKKRVLRPTSLKNNNNTKAQEMDGSIPHERFPSSDDHTKKPRSAFDPIAMAPKFQHLVGAGTYVVSSSASISITHDKSKQPSNDSSPSVLILGRWCASYSIN